MADSSQVSQHDNTSALRDAMASAILERMGRLRLNRKQLAVRSGVSSSALTNYLSDAGDRLPTLPILVALAGALRVRPGYLLDRAVELMERDVVAERRWPEEFRRAFNDRRMWLDDVYPGRPDLAERALRGDPTLDEASLQVMAHNLGLDPTMVAAPRPEGENWKHGGASDVG